MWVRTDGRLRWNKANYSCIVALRVGLRRVTGVHVQRQIAALVIGAYDGFFGPGTGTFLIITSVLVLGQSLTSASADAKVVNFASNLAAMAVFAASGTVVWAISLPMAAAQFAGGWTGAKVAVRGGDHLVRWVVLGVVVALVGKLAVDAWQAG